MPFFNACHWSAARRDSLQEVLHVPTHGRGYMLLQILFGLVLRILLQLVCHIAVDSLTLVERSKIIAVYACLQRALVTIKCCAPRVFRVAWVTPGAVLPDHRQIIKNKSCRLRVWDVCFARFVYQLTALFLRPFAGLTVNSSVAGFVLEIHLLIAIVVYALITWGLVQLVWLLFYQTRARMIMVSVRSH